MIEITYSRDSLKIKGHAGYAPTGEDLVCAAVTILWRTLVASLNRCEYQEAAGDCYMICGGLADTEAFRIILNGFRLISEHYPEHCRLTKKP